MEMMERSLRHESDHQEIKPELLGAEVSPKKADLGGAAEKSVSARAFQEDEEKRPAGPYPEAGEKVGDKGTTTVDQTVKISGKSVFVSKGTLVTVKEVKGDQLVVTLPAGLGGGEMTIAATAFNKGGTPVANPLVDAQLNPDPTNEYAPNATYGEVKGPVSAKGEGEAHEIDPSDVEQGSLGDCYFVAQLAAQARTNPQRIADLIKDNGDGTYTVTLYLKDGWKRKATPILVDTRFPMENGSVAYAKPGDSGELWPMLIEKAFAKVSGGYEQIRGSKTKDGDVFGMMSGEDSGYLSMSADADKILKKCSEALAANRAVTFGAKSKTQLDEAGQKAAKEAGVVLNHAYTLMSVDVKARTLNLRNPWACQHLEAISIDTVRKFYSSADIAAK